MAEYTEITDLGVGSRIRARYGSEIAALQSLGFHHLAYCLETLGPYSVILQFPVLLLTLLKKEVLVFPKPLRLAVANILFVHSDPSSIALCMGMGVKIFTRFTDSSILISSTFRSHAIPGPSSLIIKNLPSGTPNKAWEAHKKRALEMAASGKVVVNSSSLSDYIELSKCEEDLSQYL